ncbi:MAG: RNA-binding protein [Clostridia bacterium]|nr:RNA-binding protein [Clostridia bacterium]
MDKIKDDEIFKAHIKDKHQKCFSKNIQTETGFLDLRQQSIVHEMSRSFCVPYIMYGGYEDAQRKKLYFLPDYYEVPENNISIIDVSYKSTTTLSHRDFLGAVLATGLKRDRIGDILVFEHSAQIIVENDVSDYIYSNLFKAGKVNLKLSILDLKHLKNAEQKTKIITDTVMSLRLDSLISSAFSCSRSDAVKHISTGNVYLNDLQTIKPDKLVCEGDKLILRGKGKVILKSIGSLSKKGRINIQIEKFI